MMRGAKLRVCEWLIDWQNACPTWFSFRFDCQSLFIFIYVMIWAGIQKKSRRWRKSTELMETFKKPRRKRKCLYERWRGGEEVWLFKTWSGYTAGFFSFNFQFLLYFMPPSSHLTDLYSFSERLLSSNDYFSHPSSLLASGTLRRSGGNWISEGFLSHS